MDINVTPACLTSITTQPITHATHAECLAGIAALTFKPPLFNPWHAVLRRTSIPVQRRPDAGA